MGSYLLRAAVGALTGALLLHLLLLLLLLVYGRSWATLALASGMVLGRHGGRCEW